MGWNFRTKTSMSEKELLLTEGCYRELFELLQKEHYLYSWSRLFDDFSHVTTKDMFCFLVYSLSREQTVENTLGACIYLDLAEDFFDDIHSIIYSWMKRALAMYPDDLSLKNWIATRYLGYPESPFSSDEMKEILRCVTQKNETV